MSETNNPQPSDPPVSGSGSGTAPPMDDAEDAEDYSIATDPPTGSGGSGS